MKKLYFTIAALGLFSISGYAENYQAKISGICCPKCAKSLVKTIGSLNGVETVRMVKEKNGELYEVDIKTTSGQAITREAVAAVLKDSDYAIAEWTQKDS